MDNWSVFPKIEKGHVPKAIKRWVLAVKEVVCLEKPANGGSFPKILRLMQHLCKKKDPKRFPQNDSTNQKNQPMGS